MNPKLTDEDLNEIAEYFMLLIEIDTSPKESGSSE